MVRARCAFQSPIASRLLLSAALLTLAACADQTEPLEPSARRPGVVSALRIPTSATYTDLSVRDRVTCAVRSDGVVACWGSNVWGAAPPTTTAAVGSFVDVSTSGFHTCAVRSGGAVECWGKNFDSEAPPLVTPPSGRSFVAVSSGNGYTCALLDNGSVQCWGFNEDGQAPASWSASSGTFTAISAGGSHTCALTSGGVIECVGTSSPLTATSGTFVKVMTGMEVSCGIRTDGVVQCKDPQPSGFVHPVGTFVDYDVDYAVAGHSCGVRADGTISCYGNNAQGQAPTTKTAATGSFTRVATGLQHTCALRTDNHIECWGDASSAAVTHVLPTATFNAPASVIVGQNIPLSLSGAQVPGYPLATTFTYAFDCGTGFGSASSASATSCPTSTAGSRAVRGMVIDQDSDANTYSATVIVKSAAQGTTDLSTEISNASLAPDVRKALLAKLNAALKAIADGKSKGACSALADFINQVMAQRGKAISADTADAWINTAQQLQTAIGC